MRLVRVLIALLVCVGAGAIIAAAVERLTGQSTSSGYMVRAVFDNSSFVIPGEEVKVAGVTIGTIHAVQLTQQNKAAVVLQITNKQFEPFRTDAHCEIGIASLLGEQFVQCTPTQPRSSGDPTPPALAAIKSGPGQGQHLLPVQNTTAPIGLDLLNDINRLPEQERLRLIISGLGAGLAGNGQELNAALQRADPALQQTDKVIAVLAGQDRTLARLTDESSRVLAPLAAQRRHIAGFVQHAGTVATASAAEGQAIEQNIGDLPPFLHQLRPAAARLSNLAGQLTPALASLGSQAPAINNAVTNLGPLAKTSIPAFKTLGNAAQRGETVFPQAHAVSEQLLSLGKPLVPLSTDLASVAQSFDNAGGIEDVMRFIYYYTGAVNGEDSLGHYIRALVEISACVPRSSHPLGGCGSTFGTTTFGSAAAATAPVSTAAMLTPRWTLTWPAAGTNHATLGDMWPAPRSQTLSGEQTTAPDATAPASTTDATGGSTSAPAGQTSSTATTSSTASTSASSTTPPTTNAPATSSPTTSSSGSATTPQQASATAPASAPGTQTSGSGSIASTKKLLSYLLSP
jgi:ABC-type transporter Mla subunit MlaD